MAAAGSIPFDIEFTYGYASLDVYQHLLGRNIDLDLAAADAFSIGVTPFELATGELPVRVRNSRQLGDSENKYAMWERTLLQRVRMGLRAHCVLQRATL